MPLLHALFDSLSHTLNAFFNAVIRHVGEVDTHAAVSLLVGIEGIADNTSNLHFDALVKYLASAYTLREGEPQEQAAFRITSRRCL